MPRDRQDRQDRSRRRGARAAGRAAGDRGCPGCRGDRPAPAPPVLTDDLVIAARARAREPELPAATVERALAGSLPTAAARYDLVVLPPSGPDLEDARSLAVEFARHDHRVVWLEPADGSGSFAGPRPPLLRTHPLPPGAEADPARLTEALAARRVAEGIETAALWLGDGRWTAGGAAARSRWGWRTAGAAGDGPPPDVVVGPGGVDLRAEPSWPARWALLDRALRAAWPRASVVVVTFDNLAFNKLCAASLLANTDYPNLELLFVDNGSTDGTAELLEDLAGRLPQVRLIRNPDNRGFGPANNQGMAAASGELLVLLNNDTMVPRGWLTRLARHLDDPALGLLGPATNRTCNEAQVEAGYRTYGEFAAFAAERARGFEGMRVPIRMLAMFCTAFRRALYEEIGPLDERYAVGMFEDEDYAVRVTRAGYAVAWAPEVYVHHAYHASIGKLLPSGDYLPLFRANQTRFERKWGVCWEPHRPRVAG
jgi:GT2 family glycosyltransferase